jgi:HK97 family phage prohead protease
VTQKEIRCASFELRAEGTNSRPRITGLAARFGAKTTLRPGLNEVVQRGAFQRSISEENDTVLNFNHNDSAVCARVGAGSLMLRETNEGLLFDATVDTGISYVNDLYRNIKAQNISECSFAFTVYPDGDEFTEDPEERGAVLRVLKSVQLWDVSAVTFPQYGGGATNVSARNVIAADVEQRSKLVIAAPPAMAEVSADVLRWMKARLELAKRTSL